MANSMMDNQERMKVYDMFVKRSIKNASHDGKLSEEQEAEIAKVKADTTSGINRVTWGLYTSGVGRSSGPPVMPGIYVARLTVNGQDYTQQFRVEDDPRLNISIADRAAWSDKMNEIHALYTELYATNRKVRSLRSKLDKATKKATKKLPEASVKELREVVRKYGELVSRTRTLYFQVSGWIGPITTDQKSQLSYYKEMQQKLNAEYENVKKKAVPRINRALGSGNQIKVEE